MQHESEGGCRTEATEGTAAPLAHSADLANIQQPSRLLHARSHFHIVHDEQAVVRQEGRKEGRKAHKRRRLSARAQLTYCATNSTHCTVLQCTEAGAVLGSRFMQRGSTG